MDGFVVIEEGKRSFYPRTAAHPKPGKKKLQSSLPQCPFHRIHFKRKLPFKCKTQITRGK